jgi:hypothetical protein
MADMNKRMEGIDWVVVQNNPVNGVDPSGLAPTFLISQFVNRTVRSSNSRYSRQDGIVNKAGSCFVFFCSCIAPICGSFSSRVKKIVVSPPVGLFLGALILTPFQI